MVIFRVATVLTVYGIETSKVVPIVLFRTLKKVATVLTVYGIETCNGSLLTISISSKLQQYLPFTVLKQYYPIAG